MTVTVVPTPRMLSPRKRPTTFAFARAMQAFDYRSFFEKLLGRGWILFEVGYVLLVTLILAVFGAAAGEIGAAIFGWPPLVGTAFLAASIALFVMLNVIRRLRRG